MQEMNEKAAEFDITDDDRLWAALSWIPVSPLWPVVSILVLLMEDKQNRPFIRYHGIVSLITGIALIPLTIVTCGLGAIVYLLFFLWAYQAYQGQMVEIPVVSQWARQQGWV
ncbi:MAG TPA: hypothetical protein VK879_04715 [Candidatus Sulfomarinibacteraceae bacterium]|nr:hypothetical protein [Candidatus Sulfomarinibacteraceae bacterium]